MKAQESLVLILIGKLFIVISYVVIFAFFLYLPSMLDLFMPSKTINVCVFAETFCPEALVRFEQQTGIRVNVTYAEIDEQIYAKFRINEAQDYDVVNVSDYMVYRLGQQGLLHELDQDKIPSIKLLDERLMHRIFDPLNTVSLPHKWYAYGLAYNKAFFNRSPEQMSLEFVFKNPQDLVGQGLVSAPYRVCMLDDGRDATFMAALYLFGRVDLLGDEEFSKIGKLLVGQKQWVEAYTVHSAHYFLFAEVAPIALMSSNYMRKILDNSDRFDFAIPKEGSMLVIENLAIPKQSKKVALAHQFINFMLSDEIALLNSNTLGYNSANKKATKAASEHYLSHAHLFPQGAVFERLFIPLLPSHMRKLLEDLWLAVGFA